MQDDGKSERRIAIKKVDSQWTAIVRGKKSGKSQCKACIVKVMLKLTKFSTAYDYIDVYDEDGKLIRSIETGEKHGIQA